MAGLKPLVDREALIQAMMERTGFSRIEAEFIVALELGEVDGDIDFTEPLTADERRQFGLDIEIGAEAELDLDDDLPS